VTFFMREDFLQKKSLHHEMAKGMRKYGKRSARKGAVKKLTEKVNKLYRSVEQKYWEISGLGALPTNDPSLAVRPYGTITQGDGDYGERVGDVLSVSSVNFHTTWNLAAGVAGRKCRIVAFVYKHNPDAVITPTATIWNLCMDSAQANSINVVNSFKDHDNNKSFSIVYDKSFVMNASDSAVITSKSINFTVRIPKKYQQVQYVAAGTTIIRKKTSKNLLIFVSLNAVNTHSKKNVVLLRVSLIYKASLSCM